MSKTSLEMTATRHSRFFYGWRSVRGTAYVEYFIVAGAMVVAAVAFWRGNSRTAVTDFYQQYSNGPINALKGTTSFGN